jgi:hypothetical protein
MKMVRHETEQVARTNFGLNKYLTVKPETKSISDVQGLISDTKTDNSAYFIKRNSARTYTHTCTHAQLPMLTLEIHTTMCDVRLK